MIKTKTLILYEQLPHQAEAFEALSGAFKWFERQKGIR